MTPPLSYERLGVPSSAGKTSMLYPVTGVNELVKMGRLTS